MTTDLILGTAGHIDHGKSSLIRALTGVDPDRLPEEKRRGITIELGFAELSVGDFRLGIVDVPGHERFVRTMLAGATGMDVALLAIAADESIKQQTREHLEILRLLDLPAGVIAMTKCDLADADWMDLVEEDIREFVRGCFLEQSEIVRTSATTGEGLDALRDALERAAEKAVSGATTLTENSPFRMAIDRAFTIVGHGTVVTGSVASGQMRVGDKLVIEPGGIEVRVRQLQNHDRTVDQIHRGQRAAINLAGVHHETIDRGQELASPGHLRPSKLITVRLTLLPSAPRPLKNRARLRLHVGTAELLASVLLLDTKQIEPGGEALAQLFLSQEAVTSWNQPLVLRSESPVTTIGGGRVLDPDAIKLRRPTKRQLERLADLASDDATIRAAAALYFIGLRPWDIGDLTRRAGAFDPSGECEKMKGEGVLREIPVSPTRTLRLHVDILEELSEHMVSVLGQLHDENALRSSIDYQQLASRIRYVDDVVLTAAMDLLLKAGRVRKTPRGVALVGRGPKLSNNERKLLARLIEAHRESSFEPPSAKQCLQMAGPTKADAVPQLLALAAADGDLVEVSAEYFLHTEAEQRLKTLLAERLADSEGLTMSEIRELLGTSRKYAVPLCEYLDRIQFTRRNGDLRVLV